MKLTDDELEEWLSKELTKNPPFVIPADFSRRVAFMAIARETRSSESRVTLFIWSFVIISLIGASIIAQIFVQPVVASILISVWKFKWMIIVSQIFVVMIELLDHLHFFRSRASQQ